MKIMRSLFLILGAHLFFGISVHAARIALNVMATGKYAQYAEQMIASARTYFCTDHTVRYFVFTDGYVTPAPDVTKIYQKRLGWPHDTLMRFAVYLKNKDLFNDFDYLFAIDADMLFVAPVGSEILSKRVATQHPGFVGKRGTYETNRASAAYVAPQEGKTYFAGGFYGGERESFFSMMETVVANIEQDLHSDYIAIWHDESHLNRYFIDNPPTKILSPSYCYPETWNLPYTKRLLALDKNHHKMRN